MTLYVDTETTGLSANDEIIEIAIINDDGETLLNTLVKPTRHDYWPEAQAIHRISPKDVACAPTHDELRPTIRALLQDQEVVIYNKAYDSQYLGTELGAAKNVQCCMLLFAEHYGEWNCRYGNYQWQNLKKASQYVLHKWEGEAHRALSDTLATRAVWHYLTRPEVRQRIDALKNV
ncbi:3'-5' exonuclease [Endozoicomonas arenosclerae]|uniref:3'-5' exonuclease n=1 Tax=Endozoicomonas arenosclerae TaxID=1633495 RepID=UPI0007857417|nr:3'-5' exonuclease [Endozoicomonas arenosclerae]